MFAVAVIVGQQAEIKSSQHRQDHQASQIEADQSQIKGILRHAGAEAHARIENAVSNVGTWCSAINAGRDYTRRSLAAKRVASERVAQLLHGIAPEPLIAAYLATAAPYMLPNLDCPKLERLTQRSAKHPATVPSRPPKS